MSPVADALAVMDAAQAEIERLREINAALVEALEVLLRYVDEEADDGMMQCVETQMARDALAVARAERSGDAV